jgi:hypothetical protein
MAYAERTWFQFCDTPALPGCLLASLEESTAAQTEAHAQRRFLRASVKALRPQPWCRRAPPLEAPVTTATLPASLLMLNFLMEKGHTRLQPLPTACVHQEWGAGAAGISGSIGERASQKVVALRPPTTRPRSRLRADR